MGAMDGARIGRALLAPGTKDTTSFEGYLLILSAIIVLSLVLGVAIHSIDHALRQRKRMGYYHMFKELREEILLLGLISLLLSIIQTPLSKICVECNSEGDPFCSEGALDDYADAKAGGNTAYRSTLAAESDSDADCPLGYTQMITVHALHSMHILIFLVGGVHVLYLTISLFCVIQKLKQWKKTEEHAMVAARHGLEIPIQARYLIELGETKLKQWLLNLKGFVVDRVTRTTYLALRSLVVEGLSITVEFDFRDFVTAAIEEEYALFLRLGWIEWVVTFVWVLAPISAIIFTCLGVVISVACATKLNHIVGVLSARAFHGYHHRQTAAPPAPRALAPEDASLRGQNEGPRPRRPFLARASATAAVLMGSLGGRRGHGGERGEAGERESGAAEEGVHGGRGRRRGPRQLLARSSMPAMRVGLRGGEAGAVLGRGGEESSGRGVHESDTAGLEDVEVSVEGEGRGGEGREGPLEKAMQGRLRMTASDVHGLDVQGPIVMLPPGRVERWRQDLETDTRELGDYELHGIEEEDEEGVHSERHSSEAPGRDARGRVHAACRSHRAEGGPSPPASASARRTAGAHSASPPRRIDQRSLGGHSASASASGHRGLERRSAGPLPAAPKRVLERRSAGLLSRVSPASRERQSGPGSAGGLQGVGRARSAADLSPNVAMPRPARRAMMHLWGEGGGNLRDMDASELAYYAQAAGMCSAEEQDVVRDEFQRAIDEARGERGTMAGVGSALKGITKAISHMNLHRLANRKGPVAESAEPAASTGPRRRSRTPASHPTPAATPPSSLHDPQPPRLAANGAGGAPGGFETARSTRSSASMHSAVSQSEDAVPRRREGGAGAKRAGRLGRMSAKVLQMVPGMGEEARRQKAEKKEEVYQEILTRTAWDEMHLEDPMDLFWLGRPALVLWMMKFVFFENSLSIALLIHLAWTGDEFFRIGGESWLLVIWVTVDLLLMLHSSWVVIPLYAVVSRVAASNKLSVATYMAQNNISPREARYHADGLSPAASELASMTSEEPGERTPLTRRSPLPLARLSARQADVREAGSDHASHGAHGASWLPPPHASSSTGRECDAEGASAHGAEIEDAPDACDDLGAIPEHEEADHGPVRQNDLGRSSIGAGSGAGSRLGRSSASRRILDTILPKATRQSLSRHSANTLLGAMQASQTHQRDSGNESTPSKAGRLARVSGAPVRHRPASISRLSAPVGPRRPSSYLRAGGQGSQQAARSRMGGSAGEKRGSGRSPPTDEAPARAEKEAEMPGPSGDIPMDLLFAKLGYGGREDAGTGSATGER